MGNKDGMNYAPKGKINRVVEPGAFNVGVTALDHGHINGMTNGLIEAAERQSNMSTIRMLIK